MVCDAVTGTGPDLGTGSRRLPHHNLHPGASGTGGMETSGRDCEESVGDTERIKKRRVECDSSKGGCSRGLKESEEDIMEGEGKTISGAEWQKFGDAVAWS